MQGHVKVPDERNGAQTMIVSWRIHRQRGTRRTRGRGKV